MHRNLSPDTSDGGVEQELAALGKTAPRVTPDYLEYVIRSEHYFTAADGKLGAQGAIDTCSGDPLALLTFCVLVTRNGFTVTGDSACAHPDTFDAAIGRKLARQKAIDKLWTLEGYLLREHLSKEGA